MPSLLVHTFVCVCVLTVPAHVSTHTTETVVGVAGRKVMLPCRAEAEKQRDVEVCWGRGEPSVFTCHNTVIYATGDKISYRRSYRYSLSSSSSLSIALTRPLDSGFYHCRVQLPGLFNDQTTSVHLIITSCMFTRSPHHHQLYQALCLSAGPCVHSHHRDGGGRGRAESHAAVSGRGGEAEGRGDTPCPHPRLCPSPSLVHQTLAFITAEFNCPAFSMTRRPAFTSSSPAICLSSLTVRTGLSLMLEQLQESREDKQGTPQET
uniref:uncharacterized protein LOC122779304 isoform X7 n=1 Tax=Solea senegalensis TaxID=28829 RepID=UPI001CD87E39|nr:uncharacterized protein LOC122779304 isoform X7 [Solea senegalensis]